MFKVKDYVVYGAIGVCQVADIVKEQGAHSDEIEYYVLQSICENHLTIKTPVDNSNVLVRELISKDEIAALITTMPEQKTVWVKNGRERNMNFKAALKSGKCEEWVKLVRTIYMEKQEKSGASKKLAKSDEDIMQAAEKKLYGEFAIALNISPDEVLPYILEHVR